MSVVSRYLSLIREGIWTVRLYKNWAEIVSNHFRAGRQNDRLVLRGGTSLWIHPHGTDMGLVRELWAENTYRIAKSDIGSGAVVVDIGAHIGVFSLYAAAMARDVKVYSFEPEPENFDLLSRNIEANGLGNSIIASKQAVSNTCEPKQLFVSGTSVSAHSLSKAKFEAGEIKDSVEVECVTLEDIFKRHSIKQCDVLKLDCEGEEYNILMTAPDTILKKIRKIVAEYHDGVNEFSHKDLVAFLQSKGFKVEAVSANQFGTFTTGFLYANKNTEL